MGLYIDVLQKPRPLAWEARVKTILPDPSSVVAVFRYKRRGRTVVLTEVALRGVDDAPLLAADLQRRYPLASWEKAARTSVLDLWRESRGAVVPWHRFEAESPQGRRLAERLNRYASVAAEYRSNVRKGLRDPVAEIARTHEVKPGTARGWVYRARRLGLLGDARNRSSGEAAPALPNTEDPRPRRPSA